jgi:hypothetical protein
LDFLLSLKEQFNILEPVDYFHIPLSQDVGTKAKEVLGELAKMKKPGDREQYLQDQIDKARQAIASGQDIACDSPYDATEEDMGKRCRTGKSQYDDNHLPTLSTQDILNVTNTYYASADQEVADALKELFVHRIWKHALEDEDAAIAEAKAFNGSEFPNQVRDQFRKEYEAAKKLKIPRGYCFKHNGKQALPRLMQRRIAYLVKARRRVGNWSGTGSGKTLSAILASRVIGAKFTLILCPNSVVSTWKDQIDGAFTGCEIKIKTWDPRFRQKGNQFLILNYEMFQQKHKSANRVVQFLKDYSPDMIVVDEIQCVKRRVEVKGDETPEERSEGDTRQIISMRRRLVHTLIANVAEQNPDVAVLGMSATPIINDLKEGKSLLEIIKGHRLDDVSTRPWLTNCMALYRHFVTTGPRYKEELDRDPDVDIIRVSCEEVIEDLYRVRDEKWTPLEVEKVLTPIRIPTILQQLKRHTIVYTYYVTDIIPMLYQAIRHAGWSVGIYQGGDDQVIDKFKAKKIDILIASNPIATGIDGLQNVCNRIIINSLPWTSAEYEQLCGRVWRYGQKKKVEIKLVFTGGTDRKGDVFSWDEQRWGRIGYKRKLADAAVDGVPPQGELITEREAFNRFGKWLDDLRKGKGKEVARKKIILPLPKLIEEAARKTRKGNLTAFHRLNAMWNRHSSDVTHKRLQENQQEFINYHAAFRKHRESWPVVPSEYIINMIEQMNEDRGSLVIGDMGCGEASLAKALKKVNKVHSFDHLAINDDVVACNIKKTPLKAGTLDVAVYSLSLMGEDFSDYIKEAHRVLRWDGRLFIAHMASQIHDVEMVKNQLTQMGYGGVEYDIVDRFVFFSAWKRTKLNKGVRIYFSNEEKKQ